MKRSSVVSVLGLIVVLFVSIGWKYERDNVVFTGDAVHDGKTEFNGAVQVDGTVNFASGSIPSASLPATISDTTLISNKVMKLCVSNAVIVAGGTLTIPAGSIGVAAISNGLSSNFVVYGQGNTNFTFFITNGTVRAVTVSGP